MARNKLSDLNDHLFAQLERLSDEEMDADQLEIEIKRSRAVAQIGEKIINNANTVIKAAKLTEQSHGDVPELIQKLKS
jgi:hypothetical protein